MKLTRAGEYAVRCVLFLAGRDPGTVFNRRIIAESMDIPYQFLGKIGRSLSLAGVINITQGAQGGYALARPAEKITLLDVVEAVDGEISLNECVSRPETCSMNPTCAVHRVWMEARTNLRNTLASASFADLSSDGNLFGNRNV